MKKSLLTFIVMLAVIIPAFSQVDQQQLYERKIRSFERMKNAGWVMTSVGGGLSTAGAILLIRADHNSNDDEEWDSFFGDIFQVYAGAVILEVGIGLLAGGLTMGNIGAHKSKAYRKKLDNLSVGMICTPSQKGFSLVYRF